MFVFMYETREHNLNIILNLDCELILKIFFAERHGKS